MVKQTNTTHDLRKNGKAGGDKWATRMETEHRGRVTWRDAGPEDLWDAVASATEDGAALLLSKTSDGGALAIHVLTDASRHKLFPATQAELNEALALISEIAKS